MLNHNEIISRAVEILTEKGLKPELSPQAVSVIIAISEAVNAKQIGKMKRPTIHEVKAHGFKIGLCEHECERFFDFYESKGWKVGGQPMKIWTAAMANWKRSCDKKDPTKKVVGGNF